MRSQKDCFVIRQLGRGWTTATHPVRLEEVDHAVAVVKHGCVQVVRDDVTASRLGAEVRGDLAWKTVRHSVSVIVVLVIRITFTPAVTRLYNAQLLHFA